jgi:S1-C subfamily serine protease
VHTNRYLLAAAGLLILCPTVAHAQQGSASTQTRTYTYPEASPRGARWGFSIIMYPGPGNAYAHPIVRSVDTGSAAEAAGLMVGDTIISVDGRDMRYEPFFPRQVAGTRYVMLVRRGDEEVELTYTYPQADAGPQPAGETAPLD